MSSQPNPPPILDSFYESYDARRESAQSLLGFSLVYLSGYFTDPPATFHPELVHALEDDALKRLLIIGFRGSGKSTFGSLALPLWAALEHPEKYPFIILVSDSTRQATLNISAIKYELETNLLIKQDYGEIKGNVIEDFSLQGDGEEWQKQNIVLSNGVRILARSRGQKVRGLRHLQHRPKLVVVDDPEDGEWVRTKENRDKTDRWLHSEVMPGMDARKGKLVVIGNLLHMDALLSRLKAPGTGFKVLQFPLIDKAGKCTWTAMYPTEQSLKDKERDMGAIPWQREMLLKIVSDDEAIIKPEDITYYDEMPKNMVASLKGHGIDLAISQKESADYTTIVSGEVFYLDGAPKIYIRPNPYNEHVIFHNFMQRVRSIPGELKGANIFFVEDVGYQKAAIQEMERMMLPVVPVKPTTDKRSRLQVVAPYIKNGTVLFPRTGCEQLLGQVFNLGVESHDDLCLAGGTKIATPFGDKPIERIKTGDRVITPLGIRRVLAAGQTGEANTITSHGLKGTNNHPVFVQGCGFKPLDALPMLATLNAYKPTTAFQWRYRKLLSSMASPTASWEGKDAITYLSRIQMQDGDVRRDFTSRFGNFITSGQYRQALRFIIKTAILITTTSATWIAYRFWNIVGSNQDGRTPARQQCSYTSKESAISQRNGMPHQRGVNGIVSTLKEFGRILASSIASANFAVSPSSRSTRQGCSADIYAQTEIGRGDIQEPSLQETKPHGKKLSFV